MARRKGRASWGKVRKLPSGRYQASHLTEDGERHVAPSTFSAMIDARAWLAEQQVALSRGEWSPHVPSEPDAPLSLAEYATDWLSTRTGRDGAPLRDRTRVEYVRLLAGPLAPLGGRQVKDITPGVVRSWYAAESGSGRRTQAARAYGLLRSILGTAVTDGLLATNPAVIRGAQNATTGRKVKPPTRDELDLILNAITPRYRAAVLIAAWGGLRWGELSELRRADVLETEGDVVLGITRAVVHIQGRGFIVGPPKSEAGIRAVRLPPKASAAVVEHLATVDRSPDALLFPSREGGHLAQSSFTKHWYPARAAAGRPDLPWHGLRHYGATQFAAAGSTLKELQARLGHATVQAAMRYQHESGREAELVRRMDG